ncbi:MAG TPA: XRE family transcriptional regulator [Herpetosiphon sp.]|uniref:Uncharacterized protein n=1 Tax=Herpetosiphon aurantiacus (strain ATCC 23779 / DSM 785 / 114-95) TaxID=316274 RepID=A9AVU5_HERA2|nr:helix-turn-helix transcriptional regulator [Herpetosiphon sp.]ABX06695.1 hypothetical protein Haur_4063 [Herpetosiphon aurantiacus DSM 785]HBW52227.1 XRE family transcriptional regulator [Herpetosiphon sp.]
MRRRKPQPLNEQRREVLLWLAQRGWTLAQLAAASGCDSAILRAWLEGKRSLSEAERLAIEEALTSHHE